MLGGAEGDYGQSVLAAMPVVTAATGIDVSHVTLVTVFTTQTVHDALVAVAADRRAAPPPTLLDTLVVNETGAGPADPRVRFAGHFSAPDFRAPKPDGKWKVGPDGRPALQSTASLEFFLAFSDATHSGPRPVAIFQHGLGSDKDSTWGTAQRLTSLDVAVIGIDAPEHGSRATPPYPPGQTDLVQASAAFFGVDLDTKAFDIAIARDNFRQMACDQLEMLRFIQTLGTLDVLPVGAPDGVPDIDPSRVIYLGHSFGAVMAATFNALAPEVDAAVWNVGGAGLALLFEDSGLFSLLTKSLEPPGLTKGQLARFFSTIQAIVDPGDAANYAPYVTLQGLPGVPGWKPKDVLLEEVKDDTIVPNSSAERLARAAGLAQVEPVVKPIPGLGAVPAPATSNLADGATGGIFQFAVRRRCAHRSREPHLHERRHRAVHDVLRGRARRASRTGHRPVVGPLKSGTLFCGGESPRAADRRRHRGRQVPHPARGGGRLDGHRLRGRAPGNRQAARHQDHRRVARRA